MFTNVWSEATKRYTIPRTLRPGVCTCEAISLKRLLYLGKANLTPEEVVSVAPRQVLNFFGSLEPP